MRKRTWVQGDEVLYDDPMKGPSRGRVQHGRTERRNCVEHVKVGVWCGGGWQTEWWPAEQLRRVARRERRKQRTVSTSQLGLLEAIKNGGDR